METSFNELEKEVGVSRQSLLEYNSQRFDKYTSTRSRGENLSINFYFFWETRGGKLKWTKSVCWRLPILVRASTHPFAFLIAMAHFHLENLGNRLPAINYKRRVSHVCGNRISNYLGIKLNLNRNKTKVSAYDKIVSKGLRFN